MKKYILIGSAAVVLLVAIASGLWMARNYQRSDTVLAKHGDIVEAVYGLGTVTANQTYQLKVGITTAVREIFVREGEQVIAGAPLVRLDEAGLFRAPFAGTVTSLPFKPGETVYPQLPVATVINIKDRYIVVSLEQEGALRVRPGQVARMSVESIRGQTFVGRVRALFPGDGQFLVHIDIPELPPEIIPGMTGDVAIEIARRSQVLMVPIAAVQSGRILIKTGRGFPKKTQITLGAVDGRWAEVVSGNVKEGDEIIIPTKGP